MKPTAKRAGLVYDLRDTYLERGWSEEAVGEFDRPDTIEALCGALEDHGYVVERIGGFFELAPRLAAGERWDFIFTIAEGLRGSGREALVPALIEQYGIPYSFSDPLTCCVTLDKATTKRILRDAGIPTARFEEVTTTIQYHQCTLPLPVFVKPAREGTSKGIDRESVVSDIRALETVVEKLLLKHRQPVLVEEYLPGREVTVGIVGTGARARALGVLEVIVKADGGKGGCTFLDKEKCEDLVEYRLVEDSLAEVARELALRAYRSVGCRDAGRVDLRENVAGDLQVMEVNPIPGLHPTHSDLPILCSKVGVTYPQLIGMIVESTLLREVTHESPHSL